MLRRTLNGASNGPEYITTIPRRGYRFVADVIERPVTDTPVIHAVAGESRGARRVPTLALAAVALSIAVALLAVMWRQRASESSPPILSVTAMPGLELDPSISPDGNFVAFSWTGPDPQGIPDIWIKAVDNEALRRLTETPVAESRPSWSPDGREVAFLRAGQGVFVASALGGSERQIARSGSMVRWTPDGRSLVIGDHTGSAPEGIFTIDLDTGHRRQVTQAPNGIGDLSFDISPDGRTLAFIRYGRPGIGDLYVVPIEGGEAAATYQLGRRNRRSHMDAERPRHPVLSARSDRPRPVSVPDRGRRQWIGTRCARPPYNRNRPVHLASNIWPAEQSRVHDGTNRRWPPIARPRAIDARAP